MKRLNLNIVSILSCIFLLFSCSKERLDQTNPLTTSYSTVDEFLTHNAPKLQTFNFDQTIDNLVIVGQKGTKITIDRSTLSFLDGSSVNGTIDVDLIEILKPSEMILSQKYTTSNNQLLQSGGQFYISLTSMGQEIEINGMYTTEIPSSNPLMPMIVFEGVEDGAGFDWNALDSTNTFVEVLPAGYEMLVDRFGWINCDYWLSSGLTLVDVPAKPCDTAFLSYSMFFVFPEINSVMPGYDNLPNQTIDAQNVPVGTQGIVVGVGLKADSVLSVGYANFTAAENMQSIQLDCIDISEEDLLALLESFDP